MSAEHPRPELRLFPAPPGTKKRSPSKPRSSSKQRSASATRRPSEDRYESPAVESEHQAVWRGREQTQHQFQSQGQGEFVEQVQTHNQPQYEIKPEPQLQPQIQPQVQPQAQPQIQPQYPPRTHSIPQVQYHQKPPIAPITYPPPVAQPSEIPRSQTAFSEAPTLVRNDSNDSQRKFNGSSQQRDESMMHSIFPRYNPDLPLEYQNYFPTNASSPPANIPKTVVNRRPYSPSLVERSPCGLQSPMPVGLSPGMFPRGLHDETILEPSTNEELKQLWKVCNGWRVSPSEGRRFCLRMTSAPEEPVHTLSSSTSPFYTLRLDPTSTSAIVTLTRQDPSKPAAKIPSPLLGSLTGSSTPAKKDLGNEVLTTTLEEPARRLPPNDGLVALLYPRAASNMAIELATKAARSPYASPADSEAVIIAAERECGRLVWDYDTKKYYLAHPALQTPFYISIHSSPAWSRSEYNLEHPELPRNLVRLVRDGSGGGFLEVDSAVAARLECFYIVDVAITAVLLVACQEEKTTVYERFDAPPSIAPVSPLSPKEQQKLDKKEKKRREKEVRIEEFELDLESQDSLSEAKRGKKKKEKKSKEDKVPGCCGLLWMLIKFFAWLFGLFFKGLGKVTMFICRGCKSKRDKLPS